MVEEKYCSGGIEPKPREMHQMVQKFIEGLFQGKTEKAVKGRLGFQVPGIFLLHCLPVGYIGTGTKKKDLSMSIPLSAYLPAWWRCSFFFIVCEAILRRQL